MGYLLEGEDILKKGMAIYSQKNKASKKSYKKRFALYV